MTLSLILSNFLFVPSSSCSTRRIACGIENNPISATVNGIPEKRLMLPRVKRGIPVIESIPIVESSSPAHPARSPLIVDPRDKEARMVMPRTATPKSSTGPNIIAI